MVHSVSGTWAGMPADLVSELFVRTARRQLTAGETLFQAGDVGDGCYWLDKGLLKVSLVSPEIKEQIVSLLVPNAVVGDLAVIDGLPRSASVAALTDCELRFLSRSAFERQARERPEIYECLVRLLALRLRQADESIAAMAFLPAKGRVARSLLTLAEHVGEEEVGSGATLIPRMIHQGDIAAMAGVTRESTNRILNDWERKKLVTRASGSYRIANKAHLNREIESVQHSVVDG